jgi:hypothetical protein
MQKQKRECRYRLHFTKINSKCTTDLKKTLKLLEDDIDKIDDLANGNAFLDTKTKVNP